MPATLKILDLIGLPVLLSNGRTAGKVRDVWFDEYWRLSGIVLDARVWFRRKAVKAVRWEHVAACGEDALLIPNKQAIAVLDKSQLLRAFLHGIVRLKDMPVYTVEGKQLGRIADVYFTNAGGTTLIGCELTDGFLADLLEGRRRLLLQEGPGSMIMGEDNILVPAMYERVLERDHTRNAESDR